nr:RNA-directed DNA polymerase, eukaryota, reverse transcriptase zinc-binding domain protein [Tanacetum cinerariifolium]
MVNDDKFVEIGKENQNDHNSGIGNSQMEEMSSNKVYEFMNEGLKENPIKNVVEAGKSTNLYDKFVDVNSSNEGIDIACNESTNIEKEDQLTYAKKVFKNLHDNGSQLFTVPAGINCKGEEVVLFDEELVKEGKDKWQLIVCGYFVGCRMSVNELKYHTRRMWERYGLREIVFDVDDMCFFKFKDEEGMKCIIEQSPWIVNGKPLVVQKWDPKIVIEKEAPCKNPYLD